MIDQTKYDPQQSESELDGSFFDLLSKFFARSIFPALTHYNNSENATYGDTVVGSKNVYLSKTVTFGSEDVCYSMNVKDGSKNIFNSHNIYNHCNNIYQCDGVVNSSNVFYSKHIIDSSEILLSQNLVSCKFCIECNDLEHKSYYIQNKQVSLEEYDVYVKQIKSSGSYLQEHYAQLNESGNLRNALNSEGSFLINVEDVTNGFGSTNIKS